MRLPCPFCGTRDATEFTYEGAADAPRPPLDAPAEAWVEAVYLRDQPRGRASELWRHAHGCGSFLVIERDNVTHEVFGARLAHAGRADALPPAPAAQAADGAAAKADPEAGADAGAETAPEAPARAAPSRARGAEAAGGGGGGGGGAA